MNDSRAAGKPRLLVVEDNAGDVELLRYALADAGVDHELTVLEDGEKALAYISGSSDTAAGKVPDLAILDLNVLKYSGIEIMHAMRNSDSFASVPVIIFTSSSSPQELAQLRELGMERHFLKPPDLDEFLKIGRVVKEVLEKVAARQNYAGHT